MIKFNKILLLGLSTALFANVAGAEVVSPAMPEVVPPAAPQIVPPVVPQAVPDKIVAEKTSEPQTVIFRIENIEPIKTEDDFVKSCSFVVTVYNRLDKAIKEANIDLSWQDRVSQKYLDKINQKTVVRDDELAKATGDNSLLIKRSRNNPQAVESSGSASSEIVKTDIKIFNIPPHSQKSFNKTVETSKCFLLFDNLNYYVRDCIMDGSEKANGKNAADGGCVDKFNYINSRNPEYYSEFGDVPLDVAQNQAEDDQKTEMKKFQETYDDVVVSVQRAAEALKSIQ